MRHYDRLDAGLRGQLGDVLRRDVLLLHMPDPALLLRLGLGAPGVALLEQRRRARDRGDRHRRRPGAVQEERRLARQDRGGAEGLDPAYAGGARLSAIRRRAGREGRRQDDRNDASIAVDRSERRLSPLRRRGEEAFLRRGRRRQGLDAVLMRTPGSALAAPGPTTIEEQNEVH